VLPSNITINAGQTLPIGTQAFDGNGVLITPTPTLQYLTDQWPQLSSVNWDSHLIIGSANGTMKLWAKAQCPKGQENTTTPPDYCNVPRAVSNVITVTVQNGLPLTGPVVHTTVVAQE